MVSSGMETISGVAKLVSADALERAEMTLSSLA